MMENQRKGSKKLWKPPSFEDFNVESQCKRIKLDDAVAGKGKDEGIGAVVDDPRSVDELATHPRKIEEVRNWFECAGSERAAMLLITGPAGSAKTTTLKVVAASLNISVREWVNPVDKADFRSELTASDKSEYTECRQTDKFEDFVFRASRYRSLFEDSSKSVILVEDFPNIFVWKPKLFHEFLERYRRIGRSAIVFICTDDQSLNLQSDLFPPAVRAKFNVAEVKFNPVNQSSLMKTLKKAVSKCSQRDAIRMETLQSIAQNSNGDLRNALSNLHILASSAKPAKRTGSRREGKQATGSPNPQVLSVKDSKAEFYQALGRVLYPKTLDARSKADPMPANGRRIFLHDVWEISDSFTDSFLMLLHENYVSTCSDLKSVTDAASVFSDCDALRGGAELREYASLTAVAGLMTSNRNPKREGFKPIKKSGAPWSDTIKDNWATRYEYSHLNATCRVLKLDLIPYLKSIDKQGSLAGAGEPFWVSSDVEEDDVRIEDFDD